jgi:large conductance mechanosensitive channel
MSVFSGFKNFLMQGQLVVVAVGLSIALAFSVLVQTFTGAIITPLVNAAGGGGANGLGVRVNGQLLDFGSLVSAVVYFMVEDSGGLAEPA